jgi:DNA polymerase III delta subunit
VKFYEFLDKSPKIDALVIIEGEDPLLAQRALDAVLDRLLPEDMRALNCDMLDGPESDAIGRAAGDAVNAMPFLADRRVVVVRNCHRLRAQPRRDLWAVAENVPAGNTLVLEDLFPPAKKTKPEPFGQLAGRKALRIDTTPNADVRERFVRETLERLGAKAQPRVVTMLAESDSDVGSIRNDLEKLALAGGTITVADLERESLSVEDPKAWQYAAAVVEGRAADALAIAFELFAGDPRGAAVPLASALAGEFALLWELARPGGGELPPRHRWRERALRPIARRVGERRARYGYESAVRGFEAVVTGRIDDPRGMIELLTADLAARLASHR